MADGSLTPAAQSALDSHVHLWDPALRDHPWLRAEPGLERRFGPEHLPAEVRNGGAIVVQADCRDEQGLDEVAWVTGLAAEHPCIRGMVAHAPLERGAAAAEHVAALAGNAVVVGVRRLLQDEDEAFIDAPALTDGLRGLAALGLTFDVCIRHRQLPAATRLVARCPEVTFVLDHLGKPDLRSGRLEPWRSDLRALAAHPNVRCKLSGLATEADRSAWQPALAEPHLRTALDAFGPERCMFGSDWPVLTLATGYGEWRATVDAVLDQLSPGERAGVLGDCARSTYSLAVHA